ncbi:phosphatidate cytidylyltransferase [Aureimonas leprariae]|uniref:Phosphatidate cytidylyltransferase n=1 Tax=Plantimonas leprariae TaxID=2615207 RepID=A0A7V7PS02_9HYPH|nr:phosphatidate cytidylyltransferase [Aureimonas leprariae]KAB0681792.1 phosphatidate cytidylyltransferase [Aureimonas leprariae]
MGLGIGRIVDAPTWTDLRSRLISALVLGVVSLGLLILGGWPFRLFCCVSGLIVFDEWTKMTRVRRAGAGFFLLTAAFVASLAAFLLRFNLSSVAILVAAALIALGIGRRWRDGWWLGGGLVYAALASLAPGMLRSDDLAGLAAMGFVVCVVWPTDIFAYFTGRLVGGPKILPAISPKKTVSGSVGGLIAGIVIGAAFYEIVAGSLTAAIVLFAAVLSVLGQGGDFFESWVKRRFGVKDSGRIIPGHGGLMDRVDALVIAIGFAWMVGILLNGFAHPAQAIFMFDQ